MRFKQKQMRAWESHCIMAIAANDIKWLKQYYKRSDASSDETNSRLLIECVTDPDSWDPRSQPIAIECLRFLLDSGADPNIGYCGAIDGAETAIENLGEWEHHWEAIVLLIKRGAKPTSRLFRNASRCPDLLGDLLDLVEQLPQHSLCHILSELCLPHYKQMIKRGVNHNCGCGIAQYFGWSRIISELDNYKKEVDKRREVCMTLAHSLKSTRLIDKDNLRLIVEELWDSI